MAVLFAAICTQAASGQNVASVESVLVKKRAGSYQLVPPPPDARTQPVAVPAPTSGPFTVDAGAMLKSGSEDGTVLVLDTTGLARMQSETVIKVPDAKETSHSLEQLEGTLFFNIDADELKKTQKTEFRLKTPTALLAVKGTHFFVSCSGGTDRIGVHTGVVMVHEPVSRQTITLTAGKAVEVQSGAMGDERPLTADELAGQSNYAGLEVQAIQLPQFRERNPPPAGARAVVWGKLFLRDATTPVGQQPLQDREPDINSGGILRLTWPGLPPLKEPATFWSQGPLVNLDLSPSSPLKPVALRASVRATGCSDVTLGIAKSNGSETFLGKGVQQSGWPDDGGWLPCLIDIPDGVSELQIGIQATPDASQQMRTPGRIFNVGSIEVKDVTLLMGPNDPAN